MERETCFISIDCGADEDYLDNTTNIFYSSDANFIDSGENRNISLYFTSDIFERQLKNVRSFPEGVKNCYTLQPEQGKDNNYLIRVAFWKLYTFQKRMTYVCLVNTGSGIPFISALELRALGNSIYNKTQSGSLVLFNRINFGSATNETFSVFAHHFQLTVHNFSPRYGDDVLDRLWNAFYFPYWESIQAPYSSSLLSETEFKLPPKVMETAVKPLSGSYLNFTLGDIDSSEEFYMYFHFADIEEVQGKIRQFTILLNDKTIFSDPIEPQYMVSETHFTQYSLSGSQLNFSLAKTNQSTLPPIMNALEIHKIKEFLQSPTEQRDVDAMKKIKSVYQVMKSSWQGDPCLPINYLWDGLICSDNGYNAPSIISLNLSSSNLTGKMDVSFSNLTSLQYLDLSYNNLTGEVPNFLAELPSLKTLNLSWNNFTDIDIVVKPTDQEDKTLESKYLRLSYSEVERIADNFQNGIGKGGSGKVYRGRLSDDTNVAVKLLSSSSAEGFKLFQTEAQLLTRVHHRNLVSLFGYCDEGSSMVLVYEYMNKGNLKKNLADKEKAVLSWKQRVGIALDAAEGLEYLHNGCKPPIIHRDIKTDNILLNEKLEAKVADFGWSRSMPVEGQTHVSTRIVGTEGYFDPEYQETSRLTEKSDVYSFGIVLLELISGQPAIIKSSESSTIHIVQWVRPLLEMGDIGGIVDPRLNEDFDTNSAWKAVETAIGCVVHSSSERPTMSDVVAKLKECRSYMETTTANMEEDSGSIITEAAMSPQAR
ncbi:putative leucine-rich repeat receptor-like serine/threonine-protein kinase At2g19230 [Vitis riparia]|uniref:putative leucine-rich repeat receptor-like serine/threonine-protein kinase At2g19230 n=1 Tax=Vitis riparia TaxID=96939 RepID=UPI00155B38AA|nr:putative leucine-rich repeat receptor-like serine/threonine-protein kinase At2g19230 [Vitis riparia]